MCQIKNLNAIPLEIVWIYCGYQMKIKHTMFISKILTDLCAIKQKIKIENIFANAVCSVLLVKKF